MAQQPKALLRTALSQGAGWLRNNAGVLGLPYAAGMIGAGWLLGALQAARQPGPTSMASWILGGAGVPPLAPMHAEVATTFPKGGALVGLGALQLSGGAG